jgi:hypothetical protein
VKKVIDLLRAAHSLIDGLCGQNEDEKRWLDEALLRIGHALAILKPPPSWETPEQYKERTGEDWPDDGPVWTRITNTKNRKKATWSLNRYGEMKNNTECRIKNSIFRYEIILATEAGRPPDDWEPEGA